MRRVVIPADIRFPLERANGVQIVKTAAALAAGGTATTLLVRRSDPRPTAAILAQLGVTGDARLRVRRLSVLHRRGSYTLPRLSFLVQALALGLAALARDAVIYTRDLQLAELLLGQPFRTRRRLVYEAHAVESVMYGERAALYGTSEPALESKRARLARREGRVWRQAAAVVTTTAGIRETFQAAYGPRETTAVISNGCDLAPDRAFSGPSAERPARVVYAGQLYVWKGVDVLVDAVARVPDVRLVILGGLEGERDLSRIRQLVEARDLGARVEMAGTVPQARVAEELRRAAVVVVPFLRSAMTERHTSPIKLFEAMAAGRPIVCSDLPSSREIVRDGEHALLVPPGDAEALAAAIKRLAEDPALAERLARAAFDEAPRYSWERRAARLSELFEALP